METVIKLVFSAIFVIIWMFWLVKRRPYIALYNQCCQLYQLERYEETIAVCNKLLDRTLYSSFVRNYDLLVLMLKCSSLYELKHYEEVIAICDRFLKRKHKLMSIAYNNTFWYIRGHALHQLKYYEAAIASYDRAIKWGLVSYDRAIKWGLVSYDLAIKWGLISYDKDSYNKLWYDRGQALDGLKRYKEAIASYDRAIECKRNDAVSWYYRGYALLELESYQDAIASFQQALKGKSDNFPDWDKVYAWEGLGTTLYKLKRYEEAIAYFDLACASKLDVYDAFYYRACCYAIQGKIDLVIKDLQQAIRLNPDDCRERIKTDIELDSICRDRRFNKLLQ